MPYPRIRVTELRSPTYVRKVSKTPSGVVVSDEPHWMVNPAVGYYSSMSDEPHKGFAQAIRRGDIIMGNCEKYSEERSSSDATFTVGPFEDWGSAELSGDLGTMVGDRFGYGSDSLDQDINRAVEIAYVNAFAKMNASPLMGIETMADFGQTVEMLKRPLGGALALTSRIIKRRNRHLLRNSRGMHFTEANAKAWLEHRYGWKPLIMECQEAFQQIRKKRESLRHFRTYRASETVSGRVKSPTYISQGFSSWSGLLATGDVDCTTNASAHAGVLCVIEPRNVLHNFAAASGLTLRDVPASMWELVPLSFVVDWFVNVGPWLQAVTPVPGTTVLGSWVTVVKKTNGTATAELLMASPSSQGHDTRLTVSSTMKTERFTRMANPELPHHPVLTTRSLSTLHQIDAVSLVAASVTKALRTLRH